MGEISHLAIVNSSFTYKRGRGRFLTYLIALFLVINLLSTKAAQLRQTSSSTEQSLAKSEMKGQVAEQAQAKSSLEKAAPSAPLLQQQLLLTAINN